MTRQQTTALAVVLILVLGAVAAVPAAGYADGHAANDSNASQHEANTTVHTEANGTVQVDVTMDGEPTDAQIIVRPQSSPDEIEAVRYTALDDVGTATFEVPAGHYRLEIDAGGGHLAERDYVNVTVQGGDVTNASADVTQLYEPNDRGWYGVDPHAHSPWANSTNAHDNTDPNETIPGSANTRGDAWVVAHLAAQSDAVAISDHNMVDGHAPIKERATERGVPYLLSEEISTSEWGHHNAYALEEGNYVDPTGNMSEVYGDARESGAEAIQVNHPYYNGNDPDGIGYFADLNRSGFNYSFDGAEVYNGLDEEDDENMTIRQMYAFWNDGREYAVTSVSDNHDALTHGPDTGTPRTYAYGDPGAGPAPNGTEWAEAVENQHTFATYGPLVYFEAGDGAIPGDRVAAEDGTITLSADLQNAEGDLKSARLVRNGTVVETFDLDSQEESITYDAQVNGTKWFVLHVEDENGDRAMTSPIWVTEDGATTPDPSPTENEFDVTLSEAPDGLQSFNVTVHADNSTISDVESDLLPSRFLQVSETGQDSVTMRGADIGKDVDETDDALTLATVTLADDVSAEDVTVTVDSVTDDDGHPVDDDAVTVESASRFAAPLPGSGADGAPADRDDDGFYEDVDGDGDVDFDDAVALTFVDTESLSDEQRAALDFDGDGDVDFDDAIELAFQA